MERSCHHHAHLLRVLETVAITIHVGTVIVIITLRWATVT
jgi:hypothetical protein